MHPLLRPGNPTSFTARLDVPVVPAGNCLAKPDDLRKWLGTSAIHVAASGILYGFTAGTMEDATPESRDYPRFIFDQQERFLGIALWIPSLQGWTIPGQIGQLMTIVSSTNPVTDDLAARPLAGWKLCDGNTAGLPNLTSNTDFFAGTTPNWTKYTVGYVG